MASLLDWIERGSNAIVKGVDSFSSPHTFADPAMLEMLTPEQRDAAMGYARSAGVAGMQAAAGKNAPWYALGAARDMSAQPAYEQYVNGAAASVEALRKRREDSGRRKSVAELVARISGGEDPLSEQYTPEQIAVLQTLSPDEQAALLAKQAFPKESGISVATSGTVQGGRFKLQNGNIGAMVQTGDPANPVRIVDTGQPYISEDPSDIRSLEMLSQNPELLRALFEKSRHDKEGGKTGEANVDAKMTLPALIATNERHIENMSDLRNQLASLPTNALTGQVLQIFSSRFQSAQAALYEEALQNIGALKAQGISLQPITEKELEVLFTTSPKLTNKPDANLRIIDDRIRRAKKVIADLRSQLAVIDAGGNATDWRPAGAQAPGSPAQPPQPRQPSSIPVLPQHRQ
jgi:hypothetical protein